MASHLSINLVLLQRLFCHSVCFSYHFHLHVHNFYLIFIWQVLNSPDTHYKVYTKLSYRMASSPYISSDIKNYMRKFEVEKLINRTVNDLLIKLPEDPYSFIIGQLQQFASPSIEILSIQGMQVLSADGFPLIKLKSKIKYLNKELQILIQQPLSILSDQNMIYDQDRCGGKGLSKMIKFIKETLSKRLEGLSCEQQEDIDRQLQQAYQQNNQIGLYAINSLSILPLLLRSHILAKPLYTIFSQMINNQNPSTIKTMINCLQGGKAIGSKCKVFKYYIIAKNVADPNILQNVLGAIRKMIVSGKGGESSLKWSPDGTYVCPLDTIVDNLKIVEDAITSCGAKDSLSIGLSWAADTLFNFDIKKYQLQNPKTPFDNDQMIDYIVKLVTDKPVISYLEDPLASSQRAAWKKLVTKIRQTEATKHVKIGTRSGKLLNLLDVNLKEGIKDISVALTKDSHPELNEDAIKTANALKFTLDFVQIRAYEFRTLSNLFSAQKQLKQVKTFLILQDCTYEGYDTSLIDLCFGLDCYSNLGSIFKFDRISKLNRMKEILDDIRLTN